MQTFELGHLSDDVLLRDLGTLASRDRAITAALLAYMAEADSRRLYAPGGYSSMHEYCVRQLRLSDDAAATRIQAARAARRFPVLFTALAEGWLHLTAVRLLAPHLTESNAAELIAMATHRRKSEIEEDLARRFGPVQTTAASLKPMIARPLRTAAAILQSAAAPLPLAPMPERHTQHVPEHVERHTVPSTHTEQATGAAGNGASLFEGHAVAGEDTAQANLEARYLLKVTLSKKTEAKLRRAQALLSHSVPNGDLAEVLDRALDRLIVDLEKRKAGSTGQMARSGAETGSARASQPGAARGRHIPAAVRRAVWRRDRRRCTFVSANGVRCNARHFLEFDHVEPVARGGTATVDGIRLRCQAHNQLEAERALGRDFMASKRPGNRMT